MCFSPRRVRFFSVLGVVSWATCVLWSQAALAYRTSSELPELAGSGTVRHEKSPIQLWLAGDPPGSLLAPAVEGAIIASVQSWQAPRCTSLNLSFLGATSQPATRGDGLNTLQWIRDWRARGFSSQAAGITDVTYLKRGDDWVIEEADIYLNAENFSWTVDPVSGDARSVQAVVTHELGHLLGLLHPCELEATGAAPVCAEQPAAASTTMYPVYDVGQVSLDADDVAGVCALYPAQPCAEAGCPPNHSCTANGCQPLCGSEVCSDGQVCTPLGCRAPGECGSTNCVGLACTADLDCARGEACVDAQCRAGTTIIGDPCTKDSECADRACAANGVCATPCSPAGECSEGEQCDENGACVGKGGLGARCGTQSDCSGGYCVQGATSSPICTRSCGAEAPRCPGDWMCEEVDAERVCVPQDFKPAGGGGCSLTRADRRADRFPGYALSAGLLAWAARRRYGRVLGSRS